MAVRVRLRIRSRSTGVEIVSSALVNSGFESDKPQLLIPRALAERLGIWPLREVTTAQYDMTAGPVSLSVLPDELEVYVVTHDREKGPVVCDAVVSTVEEEVLINDQLGEALGIVILGLGSGKWRFVDDDPQTVRMSETPQYWR